MTDVISGIRHKPANDGAGGTISNVTGLSSAVYPAGTATDAVLYSGSWPDFGTGSFLTLAVGRVVDATAARVPVGKGSSPLGSDISISWVGGMHTLIVDDTGTQAVISPDAAKTLTNGTDVYIYIKYTPSTLLTGEAKLISTDASVCKQTTATPTTLGNVNPGTNNITRIAGIALYGWAGFKFASGIPADVDTAMAWMAAEWSLGNRYLWPGWIEKS